MKLTCDLCGKDAVRLRVVDETFKPRGCKAPLPGPQNIMACDVCAETHEPFSLYQQECRERAEARLSARRHGDAQDDEAAPA